MDGNREKEEDRKKELTSKKGLGRKQEDSRKSQENRKQEDKKQFLFGAVYIIEQDYTQEEIRRDLMKLQLA